MKRPALLLLVGLLAVVVVAVVLAIVFSGDDRPRTTRSDQTGTIETELPSAWSDVVAEPLRRGDAELPYLLAAPDVDAYRSQLSTPGVEVVVVPGFPLDDRQRLLEETAGRRDGLDTCTASPEEPTGQRVAVLYTDCAGGGGLFVAVLDAPEVDGVTVVAVQAVDTGTRSEILESLRIHA